MNTNLSVVFQVGGPLNVSCCSLLSAAIRRVSAGSGESMRGFEEFGIATEVCCG